jgi:nucleotidyltransferase substrate binding protein (TIGR01987 family)
MAKKGFLNFSATFAKLVEFANEPIRTDRDKAGIIQAFEFAYEQCWKALQQEASLKGVNDIGTPKAAFTFAMQAGIISPKDEQVFLGMIRDRNLTSHTYKQELADEILKRIFDLYIGAFKNILGRLES